MLSRLKKNDLVMVISGKNKGLQGTIIEVDKENDRVKVKGIALVTKHVKARSAKEQSRIVKEESFIHASKVMPVCSTTNKPCRVRIRVENGTKVRISHRSQQAL